MDYNPLIHQRRSIRLQGYDYSQAGAYFITICTSNKSHLFGKISGGKMILNDYGKIAHNEWMKTPQIRPNISLGEFIIMPNHMHGIIIINADDPRTGELHSPSLRNPCTGESHSPSLHIAPPPPNPQKTAIPNPDNLSQSSNGGASGNPGECGIVIGCAPGNPGECDSPLRFRSPSNNVGAVVRGYKSAVTRQINLVNPLGSVWHRNYYEHIIRHEKSYQNISDYILTNPLKWEIDCFHV